MTIDRKDIQLNTWGIKSYDHKQKSIQLNLGLAGKGPMRQAL